ncbi:MAG TPA: phospholipase D-like domain-containing protein [Candidatus Saccharimonadales bacterium]|nr:phospholipase D-like domain-containing protein [Candidatus Saccharimonadales bacterium]
MGTPNHAFKNADFEPFTRREYFTALVRDINKAKKGDRVLVASMGFSAELEPIAKVAEALNAAAARGVKTILIMDAFDFLVNGVTKVPGPLWFKTGLNPNMREPYRTRYNALQSLVENGGTYAITNQPGKRFTWPFARRSHIKTAIINDTVYVGGHNLNNIEEIDTMLRWRDQRTADWLYELMRTAAQGGNVRESLGGQDQTFAVDNKTTLFVDAGQPRQSIIYDEALHMIETAREWLVLTSQYFEPGPSTQALARALRRGVKITYYYSHPSMHGPLEGPFHHVAQWRERQHLPAALFEKRLPRGVHLHAKLLATEQGVMIGSHNYALLGVQLGTAEIALRRNDVAFAKRMVKHVEQQLSL